MVRNKIFIPVILILVLVGVIFTSIYFTEQSFFVQDDLTSLGTNYQQVRLEVLDGEKEWYGTGEDFVQQQDNEFECTKSNGRVSEKTIDRYKGHKSLEYGFDVPEYNTEEVVAMALVYEYRPSTQWNEIYPTTALNPDFVPDILSLLQNSNIVFDVDSPCTKNVGFAYRSSFGQCSAYGDFTDSLDDVDSCYRENGERGVETNINSHLSGEWLEGGFQLDVLEVGSHSIDLQRNSRGGQINLQNVYLRIYSSADGDDGITESTDDTVVVTSGDDTSTGTGQTILTITETTTNNFLLWGIGIAVVLGILFMILIFRRRK